MQDESTDEALVVNGGAHDGDAVSTFTAARGALDGPGAHHEEREEPRHSSAAQLLRIAVLARYAVSGSHTRPGTVQRGYPRPKPTLYGFLYCTAGV